jgi:hypothetical protein
MTAAKNASPSKGKRARKYVEEGVIEKLRIEPVPGTQRARQVDVDLGVDDRRLGVGNRPPVEHPVEEADGGGEGEREPDVERFNGQQGRLRGRDGRAAAARGGDRGAQ